MDFSVLMSVYKNDNPLFLKEALYSISLNQTIKPKQIVLVKDGPLSQELNNEILLFSEAIKGVIDFVIVNNKHNLGLAKSLNKGLSFCSCEWIARMDADDISIKTRFEKQISFLNKHSEVVLLGGYISEFKENVGDYGAIRKVEESNEKIKTMMKNRSPFNHVSVMYKKESVLAVGGYSENIGKLEDYCLWVDMASNGYVLANIPEVLVNVRVGNGFIDRRSDRNEIKDWDRLQEHMVEKRLISRLDAFVSKICIRIFSYTPRWVKIVLYKYILRK